MSDASETGLSLRADARVATRRYDDGIIKRARLYWSLGQKKAEIERLMGLPAGTVSQWEKRKHPDGEDWHEFKASLMLAPLDRVLSMVGPSNELELREEWLRIGQRVAGIGMAALEHGALMDEDGNEVRHLFDKDGKKVRVGGIRPTTATQVVAMLQLGVKLAEEQAEAIGRLRSADEENLDGFAKYMGEMLATMDKVLGPTLRRKFEAALRDGDDAEGDAAESMAPDETDNEEAAE